MATNSKFSLSDYWPTGLVLLVILYGTLASNPVGADELPPIPYLDKLIHAIMMGGLVGAIIFDWQRSHRNQRITSKFIIKVFLGVVCFSVADEIVQALCDNQRTGDPLDLLADIIGAGVAAFTAPPAVRKVLKLK